MAGLGPGTLQADRSNIEPAYLTTGDPGFSGGGTVSAHDPDSMMRGYENVFGPAAREIKWDAQRHKRHQRWHLPDALKGTNSFLTDRIDGLITDATNSPFTKNILPYLYMDQPDKKIKWNVYAFDEGMASRVPYESAARVLPQSKRSFAGYAVRQGLAIAMEHNFMMSPAGLENFRRQLTQLVGSIQLTNDLDVHMALLYAPSYQKHMDEKYFDGNKTLSQQCRMYVDLFGFVQKNENALDYLIEDAKNHLNAWGSKPPTFMMCNGALTRQMTMNPEKTNYITAGADGQRKLAQGPDLPSYRGLSIIHSRQFSTEAGTQPRDMLRRRVRVSEHYRIPWQLNNLSKRYEFYDQSRDSMFYLSWVDLQRASMPVKEFDMNELIRSGFDYKTLSRAYNTQITGIRARGAEICAAAFSTMFSDRQLMLGALLGLWFVDLDGDKLIYNFERDVEFVLEHPATNELKKKFSTVRFNVKSSVDVEVNALCLIMVRLFLDEKFPDTELDNVQISLARDALLRIIDRMLGIIGLPPIQFNVSSPAAVLEYISDLFNAIDGILVAELDRASYADDAGYEAAVLALTAQKPLAKDLKAKFAPIRGIPTENVLQCEVVCIPVDLFILRPNIEHYMLAVIFGRGGGPEELGATFWGQTELSCYDDSQHGIWGMSYKYHERAIVTNERNLIRVFDVCFDGYCGGNDARILKWEANDLQEFKTQSFNLTKPYAGPSLIVMSLPMYTNVYDAFPNPILFHPYNLGAQIPVQPDRGGRANDQEAHCPFTARNGHIHSVYSAYYSMLGLGEWLSMHMPQNPGVAAFSNETDPYLYSFHGHMASILDGQREEIQGSGHLGPNFVGVASVRDGRGMLPRGMPMLTHQV